MPKHEFTLTDAERQKLAGEIRYEVDAFHFAYEATLSPLPSPLDSLLLEAFLIHWRNLWYFLLEQRTKEDVIAADYVGSWDVQASDKMLRDRIHKSLAHISKGRLCGQSLTAAEVRRMKEHIADLWVRFTQALSPEQRIWFQENPLKAKFPPKYRGASSPLGG